MNKAPKFFEKYMCGHMILLARDRVINVRICLARGFSEHCKLVEEGKCEVNFMGHPIVKEAVEILEKSQSKDVQDYMKEVQKSYLPETSSDSEEVMEPKTEINML